MKKRNQLGKIILPATDARSPQTWPKDELAYLKHGDTNDKLIGVQAFVIQVLKENGEEMNQLNQNRRRKYEKDGNEAPTKDGAESRSQRQDDNDI